MTLRTRSLTLLVLGVALLACGDDDDATGTTGTGGAAGATGTGGTGATDPSAEWDAFCTKEADQYAACNKQYGGCQARCFATTLWVGAPGVEQLKQCLLAQSCDQLDSDDDCYVALSDIEKAEACDTILKQCSDAGTPVPMDNELCLAADSKLLAPSLATAIQQCFASHKDCATTQACLKAPVDKIEALTDQSRACRDALEKESIESPVFPPSP